MARPQDLTALAALEPEGVDRAIVGKALYEGAVSLADLAAPGFPRRACWPRTRCLS